MPTTTKIGTGWKIDLKVDLVLEFKNEPQKETFFGILILILATGK